MYSDHGIADASREMGSDPEGSRDGEAAVTGRPTWVRRRDLLQVSIAHRDGNATLSLKGELDLASAALVEEALLSVEGQVSNLVIDLRELSFIDSTGVCVIIEAEARSRANGHRLGILPGSSQVQKVLALTGVGDRLHYE